MATQRQDVDAARAFYDRISRVSTLTHTCKWLHRHFLHIVDGRPIGAPARLHAAGFDPRQVIEISILDPARRVDDVSRRRG